MARVKDPSNTLGKGITGVDGTFDFAEENVASLLPVLEGEVLDINVEGAFGRTVCINHLNGRFVVFKHGGGCRLIETKLAKYRAEIFGYLSSRDSRKKFGLGGTGGSDGLGLAAIGDDAAGKHESISRGRTAMA